VFNRGLHPFRQRDSAFTRLPRNLSHWIVMKDGRSKTTRRWFLHVERRPRTQGRRGRTSILLETGLGPGVLWRFSDPALFDPCLRAHHMLKANGERSPGKTSSDGRLLPEARLSMAVSVLWAPPTSCSGRYSAAHRRPGSIPSDPGIRGPLHPPRHRSLPLVPQWYASVGRLVGGGASTLSVLGSAGTNPGAGLTLPPFSYCGVPRTDFLRSGCPVFLRGVPRSVVRPGVGVPSCGDSATLPLRDLLCRLPDTLPYL